MSRSEEIIGSYAANTWLIGQLVEGVSHDESLLQPPFPANCLNWVVGHMLVSRNESLHLCGGKMWDEPVIFRYKSGSQPVQEGDDDIRSFEDLVRDIDISQALLVDALSQLSEEVLDEHVETARGLKPRWQHIQGLHWHETYHLGQLELLRSYILALRTSST